MTEKGASSSDSRPFQLKIRENILATTLKDNQHKVHRCVEYLPCRALYYRYGPFIFFSGTKGRWIDFPEPMLDIFRNAVATNIPSWRLIVDNQICALDLERMLLVFPATSEITLCSVAWIDDNGEHFYPRHNILERRMLHRLEFITNVSLHDFQGESKLSDEDPFPDILGIVQCSTSTVNNKNLGTFTTRI
ncbi:hypothetical protein KSP40_PGU018954 [Platanthera guangdongensis]|uniref:RCD1 WWE domain-containing protein n=1 Tax=Platanthera guangdongensis TaxID=2320717 RepID=A0ABR2LLD9_9ASPA